MRTPVTLSVALLLLLDLSGSARAEERRVCVEVILRTPKASLRSGPASRPAGATSSPAAAPDDLRPLVAPSGELPRGHRDSALPAANALPLGQSPLVYLRRLLQHFVTHEKRYQAVEQGCQDHLRVELYPLEAGGWTAFARFSGTGREERVDRLYSDEISAFAERAVVALLRDIPISASIQRDTVLRADSMRSVQRIRGTHHFLLGLGTQVRLGRLPSVQADGSAAPDWRAASPMTLGAGYQGKFENWSLRTTTALAIGTSRSGASRNPAGGHVDLGGDFGIGLHFLRYLSPRGISSFYLGAGATFEVIWFSVIKPVASRLGDNRENLVSGGLDVDLLCGVEFMRASAIQFFLEAGLRAPAYAVQTENESGSIHTWYPGLAVQLGVLF